MKLHRTIINFVIFSSVISSIVTGSFSRISSATSDSSELEVVFCHLSQVKNTATPDGSNRAQECVIKLPASGGTGFRWQLGSLSATAVVRLLSQSLSAPNQQNEANSGGEVFEIFSFEIISAGECTATFILARPWTEEGKQTRILKIVVKP